MQMMLFSPFSVIPEKIAALLINCLRGKSEGFRCLTNQQVVVVQVKPHRTTEHGRTAAVRRFKTSP